MAACVKEMEAEALDIRAYAEGVRVRVPHTSSDADLTSLLEQLVKLSNERPVTTWYIDLSEHKGISVALAGMLLSFLEQVRSLGADVKLTGIQGAFLPGLPENAEWVGCFGVVVAGNGAECEVTIQPF